MASALCDDNTDDEISKLTEREKTAAQEQAHAAADFTCKTTPPSSKRTFSQLRKEECISEVMRIGSIIIFHMISYEKPSSSYCVMVYFL